MQPADCFAYSRHTVFQVQDPDRVSGLWFSFRREIEGEYYSYFGWDEDDSKGVIGVAEVNNQFIAISMPKKDEKEEETGKTNHRK